MKSKRDSSIPVPPLRRRAETKLREQVKKHPASDRLIPASADTRRLVHELQVHHIELEMQNDELKHARDEMEAGLEKYSELYDFAPVGYVTLDQQGIICEANLTVASLLGIPRAPLLQRCLGAFVAPADRRFFDVFLQQVFESKDRQECDVRILVKDKSALDVRLRATLSESKQVCWIAVTDITKHKLAEEATARLAAIVNSSSDAIIGQDLDGIITSWNVGAKNIYGYSSEEMVGGSITRLIPADGHREEAQIMARVRKGESVQHLEAVRVAKDGRRLNMALTISPIRVAGGEITGVSKVARDITEQKMAANKVRVSETRYRRLFEARHDGVLLLDPITCKITDANPFMTKLLGYGRKQLIGKELFEIGLLKDQAASREMFRKLKREHQVRYEDLPLESKDGRHQDVEVVANLYLESGNAVIQCNIRDITARKQGEAALRASEERYRNLFNSIDEGFCVVEMIFGKNRKPKNYRFLEVNPAYEEQTGVRHATGRLALDIAPNLESYWLENFGRVALTGKPVRFTNEVKDLDRWFDIYAFRLGGTDSRKVAILINNVTVKRRQDEALRVAREGLSQYAGQLEVRVDERTAALLAANQRMRESVESNLKSKEEYRALYVESEHMQKKLRRMARQILSAQEDERRKISRELHDEVVQSLVGINVELSALSAATSLGRDALKSKITRTQRLVEKSVNAVHQFARELRPALLDDLGLIPALHAYLKNVAAREKLKIRLTAFARIEEMENAQRTVFYRVAQEALTNVIRHAKASAVTVCLSHLPGVARMEVHDNGKSFHVPQMLSAKTNQRLGLLGMRERIEMVGGTLTIESSPGKGTSVRAEIPFNLEKIKK